MTKPRIREGYFTYTVKLHRHGTSHGITVPVDALRSLKWELGAELVIVLLDDGLAISRLKSGRPKTYKRRAVRIRELEAKAELETIRENSIRERLDWMRSPDNPDRDTPATRAAIRAAEAKLSDLRLASSARNQLAQIKLKSGSTRKAGENSSDE